MKKMKIYFARYWQQIRQILLGMSKKILSGILVGIGIIVAIVGVVAFQAPTGGDTNPATAGYTSNTSWISTNITSMISTLTAIKTKTDTISAGSSYCDPNSGKYCNIKPTCDATEASVTVDGTKGFCIEKTKRTASTWEFAKMTCENAGKRLPEPFERKYTCKNMGSYGISDMTTAGVREWASNFALPMYGGSYGGVGVAIFGAGGCAYAAWARVGYATSTESSNAFRCVR